MALSAGKSRQGSLGWDASRDHPDSHLISPMAGISQVTGAREEQARYRQDWPLMASPDPSRFRRPPEKPTCIPITTTQDPSSFRRPTKDQSDVSLTPAPLSVSPRSPGASSDISGLLRQPQPTPDLYSYLVPTTQYQAADCLHLFPHPPSAQPQRDDPGWNFSCATPTPPTEPGTPDRAPTSPSQEDTFEKALWQNAVTLCEVYV